MPPLPAMRISPGRELRAKNHKRGHSLESGLLYREKEDDLALFNEVQNKERENFLLQSNDNFDDAFSTKLRYFSDYKLGISIPSRGEGSDLLNAEGDKNDYDWLITPPETPLFPSLDDKAPTVNLASRGRPRTQPVSISQSPMMEKGDRSSSRGSASPHRLSPSPRSGNSTLQSRSRPYSATHSSPPPTMRSPSPTRRLSPPSSKQSPAPRSRTPTPRRMSTGSAGTTDPSRVRGTSPVKAYQGNSNSPKIRVSQFNIPGFSSEAPPNLRTSLADRPASYVRGSSPASKNGSRYGRKSISPTATRNVSSLQSHDPDLFSSHSKDSVALSGYDDVASLQSIPVNSSDRSAPRRSLSFSKRPTKVLSSSAPKRSFDLVQQMDRKAPQNMFRPLLSSVPSSTFYVGNTNARRCSPESRNSSITTSRSASSHQVTIGARDNEESVQNKEDAASDCVKGYYQNVRDEVFVMDQADALNEDAENRIIEGSSDIGSRFGVTESCNQLETTTTMDDSFADGNPDMVICSKCGRIFHSAEVVTEQDDQLCRDCNNLEVNSTITNPLKRAMVGENNTGDLSQILEHRSLEVLEPLRETEMKKIADENQCSYSDSSKNLSIGLIDEGELTFATQQVIRQLMDGSEGAGISLLLKRSSSGKGHFVQSRSFTASNTSFTDFSYTRDSMNSMRSSIEHSSASVSSSFDLGSSRQTESQIHQQTSSHKSEIGNYRYEMTAKHKRSVSSLSCGSSHMFQVPSYHEDSSEVIAARMDKEIGDETCEYYSHEQSLASECIEAESTCTDIESNVIFNVHSGSTSVVSVLKSEEPVAHVNANNLTNNSCNSINADTSSAHSLTFILEQDATPSSFTDQENVAEVPHLSSLNSVSETEIENVNVVSTDSQSNVDYTNSKSCMNVLQQNDVVTANIEASHPAHEESTFLLDDTGGENARGLTLDETTDAILFCGSIVHKLAHEAASIAIDNESLPVEALRPTVTFVGKPNYERRDMHLRMMRKCSSKSQKARQKKLEVQTKPPPPSNALETNEKSSPRPVVGAPKDGDSMKPPKLESKCNCIIM